MDNLHYVSWFLNGLLALLGWFMKTTLDSYKDRIIKLENRADNFDSGLTDVKVHYLHKDDFSEFKQELWAKLDDIKETVKHG